MWGQLLVWVSIPLSQPGQLHPDTAMVGKASSGSGLPPWSGCPCLHLNSWQGLGFLPLLTLSFPYCFKFTVLETTSEKKQDPQRVF